MQQPIICFNRTTVECKFMSSGFTPPSSFGFNRTTVECKYKIYYRDSSVGYSFNRTTVECKFLCFPCL